MSLSMILTWATVLVLFWVQVGFACGSSSCPIDEVHEESVLLQQKVTVDNNFALADKTGSVASGQQHTGKHYYDTQTADRINSRFSKGCPSSDATEAGVIVHAFDSQNGQPPWEKAPPWRVKSDYLSASVINARLPFVFLGGPKDQSLITGSAGLIYSPDAVALGLRCSFDLDAATNAMSCNSSEPEDMCVRGCIGMWDGRQNGWCDQTHPEKNGKHMVAEWPLCAWQPDGLAAMMNVHEARVAEFMNKHGAENPCTPSCCVQGECSLYNEVVLDKDIISNNLPRAIEAIYFVTGSGARSPSHAEAGEMAAKTAQQRFLDHFGVHVPVLHVNNFSAPVPFKTSGLVDRAEQADFFDQDGLHVPLAGPINFSAPAPSKMASAFYEIDAASLARQERHTRGSAPTGSASTRQRDTFGMRVEAFATAAVVLCCAVLLLLSYTGNDSFLSPAYFLACISCMCFGIDNFLTAYAWSYLHIPSAHAGMMFLLDGVIALAGHLYWLRNSTAYKTGLQKAVSSSWGGVGLVISAGVCIAFAMLCGNIGFNMAQSQSGPHQALVCCSSMIVAMFFYWYSGEKPTKLQLVGCCIILAGTALISEVFNWSNDLISQHAFLWVFLSMVLYAMSSIMWRLAAMHDDAIPWKAQLLLIFGCMGLVGFCTSPCFLLKGAFYEYAQQPVLLAWPALNAAASLLGMWCVNLAFQKPEVATGAVTLVVDSNSIVLLTLNGLVLGLLPSASKAAGMVVVLVGCLAVCLAGSKEPTSPRCS